MDSYDFENCAKKIRRNRIVKDCEQVCPDIIDIFIQKSRLVGITSNSERQTFSTRIRESFIELHKSFTGRYQVILEIISNVPEVKIIFMPANDKVDKYKNSKPFLFVEGVTYHRSETIIVAAKIYDQDVNYQELLGTIIHEFCHFAVHEIFGSFKPYYDSDSKAREKWNELIKNCEENIRDDPIFQDIFEQNNYSKDQWIDELVVRILEFDVRFKDNLNILQKYETICSSFSLSTFYMENVHTQLQCEAEKVASLQMVNRKTLLGNENSKIYDLNGTHSPVLLNFVYSQHIIKTNHTQSVINNIYNEYHKIDNFRSTFMFIEVDFLKIVENVKHVEKALERKIPTNLIIDGRSDLFDESIIQKSLSELFEKNKNGKIVLVLHENQKFEIGEDVDVEYQTIYCKSISTKKQMHSRECVNCEVYGEIKYFLNNEAELHRQLKDYAKCTEVLERALKKFSNSYYSNVEDAKSWNIWGTALCDQENFSESIVKYQEAQRLCTNEMNCMKKIYLNNEAEAHYYLGDYENCIGALTKALNIDLNSCHANVENEKSWKLWGDFLFYRGNFSEAIIKYKEAKKLCSDDSKKFYLNIEAECYRQMKKYDKCIALLEKALESNSDDVNVEDAESWNIWGAVLYDQEKFSESIVKYQEAQRLCTDEMNDIKKMYLINEAESHYDLAEYEKCIGVIENALEIDFDSDEVNNKSEKTLILWGNSLYYQGNFKQAIIKYKEAQQLCSVEMIDRKKTYLSNEAECYRQLKEYDKCIELLEKASKTVSSWDDAGIKDEKSLILWGNALHQLSNSSEAIIKYNRASYLFTAGMNEIETIYLNDEAKYFYYLEKYDNCHEWLNKELKIVSKYDNATIGNLRICYIWGSVLYNQNKISEAIVKYQEGHRLYTCAMDDMKKRCLNNEADLHHDLNEYDKCFEKLEEALKINSSSEAAIIENARSFSLWGDVLYEQNKLSEAMIKYQEAQRICTHDMHDKKKKYFNNEAKLYYDLNEYDKCIELIEKALKIESNSHDAIIENARSFSLWGDVLYEQNKPSKAMIKFQEAQRLCTHDMNDKKKKYYNNEAEMCYDLNEDDKCIELIEKTLKIESNSHDAIIENARSFSLWGDVLYVQDELPEVIIKYQEAQRLCTDKMNDKKKEYLNNEADLYRELEKYDECLEKLNEALNIESNSPSANSENVMSFSIWGDVLQEKNEFSEAIMKYEEARRLCSETMNFKRKKYFNNEADLHRKLEEYEKCLEKLSEALKIDSTSNAGIIENARTFNIWGDVLYTQEGFLEAILKYQKAQQICADDMSEKKKIYLKNEANVHFILDDYEKCIAVLDKALKIDNNYEFASDLKSDALNAWGNKLHEDKKFLEAITKFKLAQQICTEDMNDKTKIYLKNEAKSHYNLGDYDKCIGLLDEALKIDPDFNIASDLKIEALEKIITE